MNFIVRSFEAFSVWRPVRIRLTCHVECELGFMVFPSFRRNGTVRGVSHPYSSAHFAMKFASPANLLITGDISSVCSKASLLDSGWPDGALHDHERRLGEPMGNRDIAADRQ